MDIIEMTRKLGVEIQQQEVFKNFINYSIINAVDRKNRKGDYFYANQN